MYFNFWLVNLTHLELWKVSCERVNSFQQSKPTKGGGKQSHSNNQKSSAGTEDHPRTHKTSTKEQCRAGPAQPLTTAKQRMIQKRDPYENYCQLGTKLTQWFKDTSPLFSLCITRKLWLAPQPQPQPHKQFLTSLLALGLGQHNFNVYNVKKKNNTNKRITIV